MVALIGFGDLPNTMDGDLTVFHVTKPESAVGIGVEAVMMHLTVGELSNSLTMFLLVKVTNLLFWKWD